MSDEKRLINTLWKNYLEVGRQGRPVLNALSPVPVQFGLGLIQLALDEREKVLTMSMWTRYVSEPCIILIIPTFVTLYNINSHWYQFGLVVIRLALNGREKVLTMIILTRYIRIFIVMSNHYFVSVQHFFNQCQMLFCFTTALNTMIQL